MYFLNIQEATDIFSERDENGISKEFIMSFLVCIGNGHRCDNIYPILVSQRPTWSQQLLCIIVLSHDAFSTQNKLENKHFIEYKRSKSSLDLNYMW